MGLEVIHIAEGAFVMTLSFGNSLLSQCFTAKDHGNRDKSKASRERSHVFIDDVSGA